MRAEGVNSVSARECLQTKNNVAKLRIKWYNKVMRIHEISDEKWEKIIGILPAERKPRGGRPAKDNRVMLNGIIYWLNTGIPWRDLPERFGPWSSVYSRFNR